MKNPVIIKGNKYGIILVLQEDISFDELLKHIGDKFKEAGKFFNSNAQLAITIEGRKLSNEELDQVLCLIEEISDLKIQYVIDNDEETTEHFKEKIETIQNEEAALASEQEQMSADMLHVKQDTVLQSDGVFYKGTLRSGQTLEAEGSLVVIGDVNPGASVVSTGNIIVIGRLKGMAHAGANGNTNAFVMALSMNPMQIRIGDCIARCADKPKKKVDDEAKIAFVDQENIYIEPLSKSVLSDINI